MKFIVCQQWPYEIDEVTEPLAPGTAIMEKPYQYELTGKGLTFATSVTAATKICMAGLPLNMRVVELFGGVGFSSVIIQGLLKPRNHVVCEIDDYCLRQLDRIPGVKTREGDVFETIHTLEPADFYFISSNSFTPSQWARWEPVYDTLIKNRPQAIMMNDTVKPYFHFNRERYAKILGAPCGTLQEYTYALSDFFWLRYGYSVGRAVYRPYGTYYLLLPGRQPLEEIDARKDRWGLTVVK